VCVGNWYGSGSSYGTQGTRPAVVAPPASQIPGLGDHGNDASASDARRPVVRDTDSAYVRLARQGGQRNLLSMDSDAARDSGVGAGASTRNSSYHNDTSMPGSGSQGQYQRSAPQ